MCLPPPRWAGHALVSSIADPAGWSSRVVNFKWMKLIDQSRSFLEVGQHLTHFICARRSAQARTLQMATTRVKTMYFLTKKGRLEGKKYRVSALLEWVSQKLHRSGRVSAKMSAYRGRYAKGLWGEPCIIHAQPDVWYFLKKNDHSFKKKNMWTLKLKDYDELSSAN